MNEITEEVLRHELHVARDSLDRLMVERAHLERERDNAKRERDAALALLHRLASAAKPVVDRLWESGESQPAEVIRLGEIAEEALGGRGGAPVPADNQLTELIEAGIEALVTLAYQERVKAYVVSGLLPNREPKYEANAEVHEDFARRLRDAFHLDEEPELDDVLSHGRARFGLHEGSDDE